jgi:septal ring factor EnvC (AmiA/AmiB activator)
MKSISLKEAYNILESLYPKHFNMYNSYILKQDIDKDIKDLDKWDELYDIILKVENTFGINIIENKIAKLEQILHYYECSLNELPKEFSVTAKERTKDLKADIQDLNEKLNALQNSTIFEIYEDLINE